MNVMHTAYDSLCGPHRSENQDAVLFAPERGLFAICDGMGGAAAGREAGQIAIAALDQFWTPTAVHEASSMNASEVEKHLTAAIAEASRTVREKTRLNPEWNGMGSTVVIALWCGDAFYISNLGDSRAYLVQEGQGRLLTRDHTLAASLVEGGRLTWEELRSHPLRGQLTGYVGMEKLVAPACARVSMNPGDRIVLCSDGIWECMDDETLAKYVADASQPQQAVDTLIQTYLNCGGSDNASIIVLERSA